MEALGWGAVSYERGTPVVPYPPKRLGLGIRHTFGAIGLVLEPLWFFSLGRDGGVHREAHYRGTPLIKDSATLGPYRSPMLKELR